VKLYTHQNDIEYQNNNRFKFNNNVIINYIE